ncbi:aromatase/cyclase [Streptomyces sp. NPDC046939]|uniref:aromatase/cyclase n=1 Tax=Streptomyces sp. NPDC046939 TaxID=3155376 RepID=UPI0033BFC452
MTERAVEHEITIDAPATAIYRMLADVVHWPRVFPPTIHVDREATGAGQERIRIWATANGAAKTWTSRRTLDPQDLRITFRQEVSAPPVATMGGAWLIEPLTADRARVRLLHDYSAIDDDPHDLLWIERAVDKNSTAELAALKANIEAARAADTDDLTFSFTDTVQIDGRAKDAFDFVNEAQFWSERLPHVAVARLTEDTPGLQHLEMDTRAKDGSVHTTASYRVVLPDHTIVYKQVTLPALLTLHTGRWTFEENAQGTTASSQHTVTLNTENIARVLGPEATVADARAYVREALSTNSRATLGHAKSFAEQKA